jgi:hypothetical protein
MNGESISIDHVSLTFGSPEFFDQRLQRFSQSGRESHVHVLLHSTNGVSADDPGAVECREPFKLAERLWLCRMPDKLRDVVYKACEPPGEPYEAAHRQYGQLYTIAFFMGPPEVGTVTSWDGYRYISKFVTYSQLVHPTSIGFGSTAVLIFDGNGEFKQVRPGPCRGITEYAFTLPDMRNWLSKSECEEVKSLFENANTEKLPDRVARAHWSVQHAAYQYFFEVKTLLVASGIDSLVHVRIPGDRTGTGRQFINRTAQLAAELGIPFTLEDASAVWEHRSDISHGRDPWASLKDGSGRMQQRLELKKDDEVVRRYLATEQILRSAILKCLADPAFSARFDSDASVKKAYPVTVLKSRSEAQNQ